LAQLLPGKADAVQHNAAAGVDPWGDGGGQGLGLFHDLFDHKMGVTALFRAGHVPIHGNFLFLHRMAGLIENLRLIRRQPHHLMIRQLQNPAGVSQQSGNIRSDEIALLRQPDDQRAGVAHRDHLIRMFAAKHAQGVRALQLGDGRPDGGEKIPGIMLLNQMSHHLRVRFGQELDALFHQLFFQGGIIFDDAVVHHGKPAAGAAVRMGVLIAGLTVGGPACMSNAHCGFHPLAAVDHLA